MPAMNNTTENQDFLFFDGGGWEIQRGQSVFF